VKQYWYNLKYVKVQTENICLEAVKQCWDALMYVEKYYQSVADIISDEDYLALWGISKKEVTIDWIVYIQK
jgi:hypothetical protein